MTDLRLTKAQERVLTICWHSKSDKTFSGHDLNVAHRLAARDLLDFVGPLNGGLRGVFRLSDVARDYPPELDQP